MGQSIGVRCLKVSEAGRQPGPALVPPALSGVAIAERTRKGPPVDRRPKQQGGITTSGRTSARPWQDAAFWR